MTEKPLTIWKTVIPENWIDYNSHMTEGYYGVAFADASDEFLIHVGFDANYRSTCGTFYTVEAQIRFLEELKEGSSAANRVNTKGAQIEVLLPKLI